MPSSKIFYWPFQGGTSFVDLLCFCSVLCLLCLCASVYMCFVVSCWERADLLALVCVVFCEFVTFPLVSWVRCGTWLYRFLIFAPLLTFMYYYIESQYLTHEVSTHPWGQVSTARGQYYYIEFKYLTHEVSTHHWGQVSSARCQYYYFKSKYLRPSFYCKRLILLPWVPVANTMMSVHITEAKFLLLKVSTTTLSPSIWHLKSVPITEAKFLLLEVSTTTLSPRSWHIDVSTHQWG